MFSWVINKLKSFGVRAAVEGLDNLKAPLGDQIQKSIDEFGKLDGRGVAILVVDEAKLYLYSYFGIKPAEKEPVSLIKK